MPTTEFYLGLTNVLHALEEIPIKVPAPGITLKAIAIGIPVVVLIHDLSDLWMPKKFSMPILTFFRRRWVNDPNNKAVDLMTFRNLAIFFAIASIMHGGIPRNAPIDYLADRLTSTSARRSIDREIADQRTSSLEAGNRVMSAHAFDETKARLIREAALHRRHINESRDV